MLRWGCYPRSLFRDRMSRRCAQHQQESGKFCQYFMISWINPYQTYQGLFKGNLQEPLVFNLLGALQVSCNRLKWRWLSPTCPTCPIKPSAVHYPEAKKWQHFIKPYNTRSQSMALKKECWMNWASRTLLENHKFPAGPVVQDLAGQVKSTWCYFPATNAQWNCVAGWDYVHCAR